MTRGTMPINKDEYNNKKEYYDYQRKVEYNREQIEKATERFNGRVFNQHDQYTYLIYQKTYGTR